MSKNIVETGRPQMTIWRMRIAFWIRKATNTRSEYVILLFHYNNGSMNAPKCYTCVGCLVTWSSHWIQRGNFQ